MISNSETNKRSAITIISVCDALIGDACRVRIFPGNLHYRHLLNEHQLIETSPIKLIQTRSIIHGHSAFVPPCHLSEKKPYLLNSQYMFHYWSQSICSNYERRKYYVFTGVLSINISSRKWIGSYFWERFHFCISVGKMRNFYCFFRIKELQLKLTTRRYINHFKYFCKVRS